MFFESGGFCDLIKKCTNQVEICFRSWNSTAIDFPVNFRRVLVEENQLVLGMTLGTKLESQILKDLGLNQTDGRFVNGNRFINVLQVEYPWA